MTTEELQPFIDIASGEPFLVRKRLKDLLATITPEDPPEATTEPQKGITESQLNSWFLWLSQIERSAENEGITWNHVVKHTHQLRITKEGLHEMAKQLMEALWNINSIKQVKKLGHIDVLIDHFTDLFSKVGLELPPFPHDAMKGRPLIEARKIADNIEYPEDIGQPKF